MNVLLVTSSQDVHKAEHIFPYNCDRKEEFIRKGQGKYI